MGDAATVAAMPDVRAILHTVCAVYPEDVGWQTLASCREHNSDGALLRMTSPIKTVPRTFFAFGFGWGEPRDQEIRQTIGPLSLMLNHAWCAKAPVERYKQLLAIAATRPSLLNEAPQTGNASRSLPAVAVIKAGRPDLLRLLLAVPGLDVKVTVYSEHNLFSYACSEAESAEVPLGKDDDDEGRAKGGSKNKGKAAAGEEGDEDEDDEDGEEDEEDEEQDEDDGEGGSDGDDGSDEEQEKMARLQARLEARLEPSAKLRARIAACARLLAPLYEPATMSARGSTNLAWACRARLHDLVKVWAPTVAPEVLHTPNQFGKTALEATLQAAAGSVTSSKYAMCRLTSVEQEDAADCARALLATGHIDAGRLNRGEGSNTNLYSACAACLPDVVAGLLAHPSCTEEIVTTPCENGDTAFAAACAAVNNPALRHEQRVGAAACAKLLVDTGYLKAGAACSEDSFVLAKAADAGLPEVVKVLLAQPECTAEVVTRRDSSNFNPFSSACCKAGDVDTHFKAEERANAAQVMKLLLATGWVQASNRSPPSEDQYQGTGTNFFYCAYSGQAEAVATLLAQPCCTEEVVNAADGDGDTPFCMAAKDLGTGGDHSEEEKEQLASILRMLVGSGKLKADGLGKGKGNNLLWACLARMPDLVATLLAQPECTEAVINGAAEDESQPFDTACTMSLVATEAEVARAAECASLLVATGKIKARTVGASKRTNLIHATVAGFPTVLSTLLAEATSSMPPHALDQLINQKDEDGRTAFSVACAMTDGANTAEQRARYAACAQLLVDTGKVKAEGMTKNRTTNLGYAASAGLPNVLRVLLAQKSCTEAVVMRKDEDGDTAFIRACMRASDDPDGLTELERAAAVECVMMLLASGKVKVKLMTVPGLAHLTWPITACIPDAVEALLAQAERPANTLDLRRVDGASAFDVACEGCSDDALLPERRREAAECARLLVRAGCVKAEQVGVEGRTELHWAAISAQPDLVSALLAQPGCTPDVINKKDENGGTAFALACANAGDPALTVDEMEAARECARRLLATGCVKADTLSGSWNREGITHLAWAAIGGMPDVVEALLAQPDCTDAVVNHMEKDGTGAFHAACDVYLADGAQVLAPEEADRWAACARLILASGKMRTDKVGPGGNTHLLAASNTCSPDLITSLLALPTSTEALVNTISWDNWTPFSTLCVFAGSKDEGETAEKRRWWVANAKECVRILAASGKVRADVIAEGTSHLICACQSGEPEAVAAMLSQPCCTPALVNMRDVEGDTAYKMATARAGNAILSEEERVKARECTRLLEASGKLAA